MPSSEPFVAVHVDAVPAGPDRGPGIGELKPVRRHLGIEAFGANARVAHQAGEVLVMPHDERAGGPYGTEGHEELYVVLRGHATFTLDDREVDAPAGTLVFVRSPEVVRSAVAKAPDTAVLAVGAPVGAAFRVAPWEQRDIDTRRA
jgi:AraC-like protein